ncbi:amino acid transporter [Aaosphaeria arxii CBS 175.79]|uniref:Amino acid transporter n=1 Tax=Aaosphaeria arxii CBS 175.79 TaxID=1450172 RepID=A0A6A5X6Z3_9PLEO|nr:amino acid transporter [Aaosphaeria arxii CBS 175.79]KAF2008733.1 amino acid transporter [Aaosphaeria arxii CBS 175.79]
MRSDEQVLAHFGKKQQLKRVFGLISCLGLGCTLMLTWEGSFVFVQSFLLNGGPTGAFAAFPIVTLGVLSQVLVMAEMASMIPLSGGEYNWVAILAPKNLSNFLSYMTGWVLVIAWQGACASVAWINSTIVLGLVQINYPDYETKAWHGILIFYAVVALALLINTYLGRVFLWLEAVAFIVHVVGFFAIMIVLMYLAPKSSPTLVFDNFMNLGGLTNIQSALVGSVTIMYMFNGVDGATHMAEEIENAAVVIPQALIITVLINGAIGWAALFVVFFCMGSVEDIMDVPGGVAFVSMFASVTKSVTGASLLTCIILTMGICGSIGLLGTASRMLWAFAREDGVPLSTYISRVRHHTSLPIFAISITAFISLSLALVNLGSVVTFNALTGLTVAGFYSAFMVAGGVMLYRRLTTASVDMAWGPFCMGRLGVPITIFAMIYSFIGWFFSFWPPVANLSASTFNWSLAVYFGVLFIAIAWWGLRARKTYKGPKVEI